ncbi:MAG: TIGR03086 family metal-binding protein [Micromonosporaceae bacterium]
MTPMLDLEPAARQLRTLLAGVSDDHLPAPTPSEGRSVADLLDHLMGLTVAFRDSATKTPGLTSQPPVTSAENLDPGWREKLPVQLDDLVAAWRDPAAWEGMAEAGGVTLPAEVMAAVALDELVLHGWDLARSTGQPYHCDPESAQAVFEFASASAAPGEEKNREGLFGPVVPVPDDAPLFDRALGFSGRDPAWTP